MIDQPHTAQTIAQQTAVIRLTVPRSEIRNVMGPAISEVFATITAQGLSPTGPLFSHHLSMMPDIFDLEVGVPVAGIVTPAGRVIPSHLRATVAAQTVYHGPYEELGPAWGEFCEWISAKGLQPAPDLWEYYRVGPESGSDPAIWETDLIQPLIAST